MNSFTTVPTSGTLLTAVEEKLSKKTWTWTKYCGPLQTWLRWILEASERVTTRSERVDRDAIMCFLATKVFKVEKIKKQVTSTDPDDAKQISFCKTTRKSLTLSLHDQDLRFFRPEERNWILQKISSLSKRNAPFGHWCQQQSSWRLSCAVRTQSTETHYEVAYGQFDNHMCMYETFVYMFVQYVTSRSSSLSGNIQEHCRKTFFFFFFASIYFTRMAR